MRRHAPLRDLLSLALAATLLFVATLACTRLPCWALPLAAVPVAWPIWAYHAGNALFARRLWLGGVTHSHSRVRRWFSRGLLIQSVAAVFALALTALLLPMAALLRPEHWAVLALDVLLLSLAVGPVQRRLAAEVQTDKVGLIARRWPLLLLNLLLLAAAFLAIDFAVGGAADSRGMPWHRVAEDAFTQTAAQARCDTAGWLIGALAAVQALSWHASQLIIPSLPDPALKLAAWTLFLARAGLFAWLFTSLLLGTLTLVEQRLTTTAAAADARPRADTDAGSTGIVSTAFIYTILLLAVPYLYAVHKLQGFDPSTLEQQARAVVTWSNPCRADPELAALSSTLNERLQQVRRDAIAAADRRIDDDLDALFGRVEQGIDAYLDWYFTVIGEYQRLAALAVGDFGTLMTEQLETRLFTDTGFDESLQRLGAELESDTDDRIALLADSLGSRIEQAATENPCTVEIASLGGIGELADLHRDAARAGTAIGVGAGAAAGALTAKLLAKKTAAAVTTKLAAKKSFQTAAALAGKVAAKKGGSTLASALGGAALCAPSGPWAVLCGIGAGAAAWFAVDKAMIELDEVRFRAEMRADLLAAVGEQRALLASALKARQTAAIDARLAGLAQQLERRFVPLRDGM